MSIVVYAESSDGTYPGHLVIGQEPAEGPARYFGYRFDPFKLPPDYQSPEQWRDYLFDHAVPGKIVDETNYVRHLFELRARVFYEKRAECDSPIESRLPPPEEWDPHAWYSFNPDNQYPGQQPCYNCVKWATVIANGLIASFLPVVRQGRLRLILVHLHPRHA